MNSQLRIGVRHIKFNEIIAFAHKIVFISHMKVKPPKILPILCRLVYYQPKFQLPFYQFQLSAHITLNQYVRSLMHVANQGLFYDFTNISLEYIKNTIYNTLEH